MGWVLLASLVAVPSATRVWHDLSQDATSPAVTAPTVVDPVNQVDPVDVTLHDLLASTKVLTVPRPSRGGSEPGGHGRAAEVLVRTPAGPGLLRVHVRPSSSCAEQPCRRTTEQAGDDDRPASLEAVVDARGVEVRIRAWAGPEDRGPATLDVPPMTLEDLTALANDDAWR